MEIKFKDCYGQFVSINNETSSGNLRIRVNTTPSLNDVRMTKIEDCDVVTDISLDESDVAMLIAVLTNMQKDIE